MNLVDRENLLFKGIWLKREFAGYFGLTKNQTAKLCKTMKEFPTLSSKYSVYRNECLKAMNTTLKEEFENVKMAKESR